MIKNLDDSNYFDANRKLWNDKTSVHLASEFYRLEAFKKGWNSLRLPELDALPDVDGKSLLHLQCHFGQDTLSWARMGAQVTGIDLSDDAIVAAHKLALEIKQEATFIRANVYDTNAILEELFDIVFTSYGTVGWLPDLAPWAEVVANRLQPGGTFCMVDFHPFIWMLDDKYNTFGYDYFNTQVIEENTEGTYTNPDAPLKGKSFSWNHPISEILGALLEKGLVLKSFDEYDWSAWKCFPDMEEFESEKFRFKHQPVSFPYMYRIVCERPKV